MEKVIILIVTFKSKLIESFAKLEYGDLHAKMEGTIFLTVMTAPVAFLGRMVKVYILPDTGFIEILFWLLVIDLITGIIKHLQLKTFDWGDMFIKFGIKLMVSFMAMILFNAISNIDGMQMNMVVKINFLFLGKLMNAFYVGGSALNNMFIVTGGRFPPVGWMERMKSFNTDLNISNFISNNKRKKAAKAVSKAKSKSL